MAKVLYVELDDEISDVIESVRHADDSKVALVVPHGAKVFHSKLNFDLLSKFSKSSEKETALITGEPRVQQMSRDASFPTYASVQAYERGVELVRPHDSAAPLVAAAGGAAVATAVTPPQTEQLSSAWSAPPPPPPSTPAKKGLHGDRRRAYIFGGIAAGIVGLVLLIFVSPSATVTVHISATPLQTTPVIQGSTDASFASQNDHVQTQVVQSNKSQQFAANPSGSKQLPATAASGKVQLRTDIPSGANFLIPKNEEFDTSDGSVKFFATADTEVCIGPNGNAPISCPSGASANSVVAVQDGTAEAKGNVAAGSVTKWPQNPCNPGGSASGACAPSDLTVTNPQAMSGGADAKTVTSATDSDISNWNSQVTSLTQSLTTQVISDMKSQGNGKSFALDPTQDPNHTGTPPVNCTKPTLPNSGDQFSNTQLTVTCQAKATVYDFNTVKKDVIADLNAAKPQAEVLDLSQCKVNTPTVTQASDDGTIVLSVSTTNCFSTPQVNLDNLKGQLTCRVLAMLASF